MGERIQLINPYPASIPPVEHHRIAQASGSIGVNKEGISTTPSQHSAALIPANGDNHAISGPVKVTDGPLAGSGVQSVETSSTVKLAVDIQSYTKTAKHPHVSQVGNNVDKAA